MVQQPSGLTDGLSTLRWMLPGFELVGLPDTSVKESKEQIRTAIRNSGIQMRQERVTVNLAPADVRKDSSGLDLPIAVGLLASYGMVPELFLKYAVRIFCFLLFTQLHAILRLLQKKRISS